MSDMKRPRTAAQRDATARNWQVLQLRGVIQTVKNNPYVTTEENNGINKVLSLIIRRIKAYPKPHPIMSALNATFMEGVPSTPSKK